MNRNSYEVSLLHMLVVFNFFNFFVSVGKPIAAVPVLFLAANSPI
jgi:hypothetical protein